MINPLAHRKILKKGTAGPDGAEGDGALSKLERLAELREAGALTDAEFEEQKRRLLGGA